MKTIPEQIISEHQALIARDEDWMRQALEFARQAEQQGEVPVGAVIVKDGMMLGQGYNQSIAQHDPSAHAEIVAIRKAGQAVSNYRLIDATLYVTLEPCVMCMGAILHARIKRLVFGATDPKRGAVCSALQLSHAGFSNHRVEWTSGTLERSCSRILSVFFQARRG